MAGIHDISARRFTAFAGCCAVLPYIASTLFTADIPGVETSSADVSAYITTHGGQLLLAVYVWGAVAAATLCFLTGLWYLLRHSYGEGGINTILAMLGLGAGYVTFALVLGGFVFALALGYRGGSLDPLQAKLLLDLTYLGVTLSGFPTAVSTGAFAVLVLRTGTIARWTGWVGVVVVIAHVIAAGSFAQSGLFSPSGFPVFGAGTLYYLWVVSTIIVLLRRARSVAGIPPAVSRPVI